LVASSGCFGARSRAERIELERNPLRSARAGESLRFTSVRDGTPGGEHTAEEWTFSIRSVQNGYAHVEVSILGPPRSPPSPSPREPGFELELPTKDDGWNGVEVLRLFRHPELTTRGLRQVLDRGGVSVGGGHEVFPLVVDGRTRLAHALTVTLSDGALERASYRIVIVDDLPGLGIAEAELDEVWTSVTPDGDEVEQHRHDKLVLAK
jgi:hypothetical protein